MFSQNAGELWVTLQAKKGNITDTLNEVQNKWQQTAVFAQKYNEMLTSPAGQAALRQITQAQSQVQWQRLVAEQGRFGAALTVSRDRLQQMGQALSAVMGASPVSFGAAVGWMERMAAAASPAVWQTFTGSWELLAAVIGRQFTPYLIEASRWIQRFAFWIKEMDPATRSNIASWFAWGVAILGVGTIVGHFIGILGRLLTALGAVRGALGLGAVGGGTLLAGAAVIAGVGFGFADAVRSQGEIRQRNESIAQRLANIPAAAGNAIFQVPQLLGTRNPSLQQGQALMNNVSAIPGIGFVANAVLGMLNRSRGGDSGIRATGYGEDFARWFMENPDEDIARRQQRGRDTIAGAAQQRKSLALRAGLLGSTMMGGPLGLGMGLASVTGARQTPERPLLTETGFQSQFYGIEDQWRRLQQTAATMSPLRQEIFQIQQEQLTELVNAINEPAWANRERNQGGAG